MHEQNELVIVNSRGSDDERSSVAWSVANTAAASGMQVTVFLVASGVDWARKGAADVARPNPMDPTIGDMIATFLGNGGKILICPPCAKVRGYSEEDIIDGASLAGAPARMRSTFSSGFGAAGPCGAASCGGSANEMNASLMPSTARAASFRRSANAGFSGVGTATATVISALPLFSFRPTILSAGTTAVSASLRAERVSLMTGRSPRPSRSPFRRE